MKSIKELKLGFNDAENYKKRENRSLFNKYFTRTGDLFKILDNSKYFLIGDKGTGKTALAVYLANSDFGNTRSSLHFIRETDYQKFIHLKNEKQLSLSDYTDIWKVIIYLLAAKKLEETEKDSVLFSINSKFKILQDTINEFYNKAFSPEIPNAIKFIEDTKRALSILNSNLKIEVGKNTSKAEETTRFQINLMDIQRKFESCFKTLNLTDNHIIFIDGIDIRPRNIKFEEYLDCVKGLANAVWFLNNDFFANIKGSKGRIKIVMLIRPDIFASLALQNTNNKIKDNSVLLDWRTNYPKYRESAIFEVVDNIFNSQQEEKRKLGETWDYYFPFKSYAANKSEDSFIPFLRFSMCKPRDLVSMLGILQEIHNTLDSKKWPVFTSDLLNDNIFRRKYSDYLLGEIKDYLSFYHSEIDYELFLKFFEFLDGVTSFSYKIFFQAYEKFALYIEKNWAEELPIFFESSDKFLQFLFELNIICYIESTEDNESLIHWCYRERSYSTINPKVKLGVRYQIHYGLVKSFNVGKQLKVRTIAQKKK